MISYATLQDTCNQVWSSYSPIQKKEILESKGWEFKDDEVKKEEENNDDVN